MWRWDGGCLECEHEHLSCPQCGRRTRPGMYVVTTDAAIHLVVTLVFWGIVLSALYAAGVIR